MVWDPVFWTFVAIVVVVGFRALNAGIRVSFDYETAEWAIDASAVPFLPGSVDGAGFLPFAAALSTAIVVLGCRHALGKSARMMFLVMVSSFSGIAALVSLFLLGLGDEVVAAAVSTTPESLSGPGLGFALCLLCSASALFAAVARDWGKSVPFLVLAVAGNAAAVFVYPSSRDATAFALAYIALLVFAGLCAWKGLVGAKGCKLLVVVLFSMSIACAVVDISVPGDVLDGKLSAFVPSDAEVREEGGDVRSALSGVAANVWSEHPWTGVGIGAFEFCPRFYATQEELEFLPVHVQAVPNCWWHILAERGIVGVVLLALPLAFLLFSYFSGAFRCACLCTLPDPAAALAPLALSVVVFAAIYGTSMLRAEVLTVSGAILAISAKSFPKRGSNG